MAGEVVMRRGGWLAFALFLVTALCCARPAAAADEPAAPAGAGHAAAHGGGDESPFAGPANQILDLAIWTIVVFLVLMAVLGRFAWKPMLAGLKQREDSIRGALAEAAKARDEAHALRGQLQKEFDQAHQKVREIIDEARRDAEALHEQEMVKTRAEIQTERERLHREIEGETDRALQRIWTQAADLATQASAKALGRSLDGDAQRRLIDEALADLRQSATRGTNGHA
jgi:F-type H+-transporting ATPase subunit b